MNDVGSKVGNRAWWVLFLLMLIGGYIYLSILRPLSPISPEVTKPSLSSPASSTELVWPKTGQAAISVLGSGSITTHGIQSPVPTASTAKLITALVILEKKPLRPGERGPTITLASSDVDIYKRYAAAGGSVLPVKTGEKLTEYQMLQAIMLPSANNIADSLAIWAFGSLGDYSKAANNYLKSHRLTSTHVGSDASGLAPDSTSTARDLTAIGKLAMQHRVLSEIARQPSASGFPLVGTIRNVNFLLGTYGIVGVKTGNSDEAGGAYVTASKSKVGDREIIIVGSVAGSPTLFSAMKGGLNLLKSAQTNFKTVTVAKSGQAVSIYRLPWGGNVTAVTSTNLDSLTWDGASQKATVETGSMKLSAKRGDVVGHASIVKTPYSEGAKTEIVLTSAPTQPGFVWRLTHPFQ